MVPTVRTLPVPGLVVVPTVRTLPDTDPDTGHGVPALPRRVHHHYPGTTTTPPPLPGYHTAPAVVSVAVMWLLFNCSDTRGSSFFMKYRVFHKTEKSSSFRGSIQWSLEVNTVVIRGQYSVIRGV